jgi:hypothetical protein
MQVFGTTRRSAFCRGLKGGIVWIGTGVAIADDELTAVKRELLAALGSL